MGSRIDFVRFNVYAGALDLSPYVTKATIRLGFDIRTSEAEIELTQLPDTVNYWDQLQVYGGLLSLGGDTTGNILRFDGFVYDLPTTHWPATPTIIGKGPLILAERLVCPDDNQTQHLTDPLANPADYQYDAPGIDLSFNPDTNADWTDEEMVTWLLGQAGLTSRLGFIGGTGRKLGSIATDAFTWRRRTSALSFAEQLDAVCIGFATFERLPGVLGQIVRAQTSPLVPFLDNRVTLTEGADILEGAKLTRSASQCCNRVVVQGFDAGGGPESFVAFGSCAKLPPNILYQTDTPPQNAMLELSTEDEVIDGFGLSCEAFANWRRTETQFTMIEGVIPTWRDDPISPGDVVYANAPHLDNVNQALWCKHLEIVIEGGDTPSWTQNVTVRGAALRDRSGLFTGGSTLPATMAVVP